MRIFVTGATGWVGSALVSDLLAAGHQVLALTRSDKGASVLAAKGAEVMRGTLDDHGVLRRGADASDGVAHLAFNHDFSNFAAGAAQDRKVIETMGEVLRGSDRPILATSGFEYLTDGTLATEDTAPPPVSDLWPRASEAAIEALAESGVRAATVRFATSVHGVGEHGFVQALIGVAREKRVAAYIGKGDNVWPAVHRDDAAQVYRLALESGVAEQRYHAVDEEGVAFRKIAEAIARGLEVPIVAKSPEDAEAHFGWFGQFAGMNMPASSRRTREVLGWTPTGPGFLADITDPAYYEG